MARRATPTAAGPFIVVAWLASCVLYLALVARVPEKGPCAGGGHAVNSQAYYYAIFALILLALGSMALAFALLGAFRGHYRLQTRLSGPQRTLIMQIITLMAYYLVGALVFGKIEGWPFLDAFYWVDLTLLTVGLGSDFVPRTTAGRALLFPFAVVGICLAALVVGSTYVVVFKRVRPRFWTSLVRPRLKKAAEELEDGENVVWLRPFHRLDLRERRPSMSSDGETDFEVMRKLLAVTRFDSHAIAVTLSIAVFLTLWLVGAVVFMAAEGWSYFESWYFCYIAFTTIGYGDLAPSTAAGRSFFVLWTMMAVPALTLLISDGSDMFVSAFRSLAGRIGSPGGHHRGRRLGAIAPGFNPNESITARAGQNDAEAVPPVMELATLAEVTEHCEVAASGRGGEQGTTSLARETSRLIREAQTQRRRTYSFQEWSHFLRVLGRDESLPLLKPGVSADGGGTARRQFGWISEGSPLMADSEPEWLLQEYTRLLVETIQAGSRTTS